jgi:acetyltransferase-like isoleucine patch superfamily enzyme
VALSVAPPVGPRVALWTRLLLRAIQEWDRLRLRRLARRHPGLEVDPGASSNFACARFELAPGARLRIGAGAVTERRRDGVRFAVGAGAAVEVGEGSWLRSDLGPVNVVAFEGARLAIGPECFLNGCHLSAKRSLTLGRRAWVGPGCRVFDSDQHDFDDAHPERTEPVEIGDFVWIAADTTVLRGVRIGEHAVVGARSLVTDSIPAHTLAYGAPAAPRGSVGDRSRVR